MTIYRKLAYVAITAQLVGMLSGCCNKKADFLGAVTPAPLGAISDPIWQKQEENAEASDFVIHEHEFIGNSVRLNRAGEEHLMSIASRAENVPFPIIVQTSSMSPAMSDKDGPAVNGDVALDVSRRDLVVMALEKFGVDDAENRVVVGPALTQGFEGFEAEGAILRGFSRLNGIGSRGRGGRGGF
jgi:hypothetical protein